MKTANQTRNEIPHYDKAASAHSVGCTYYFGSETPSQTGVSRNQALGLTWHEVDTDGCACRREQRVNEAARGGSASRGDGGRAALVAAKTSTRLVRVGRRWAARCVGDGAE